MWPATNHAPWRSACMKRTLIFQSGSATLLLATAMGTAGCSDREQSPVAQAIPAEVRLGAVSAAARPAAMAIEARLVQSPEPDAGAPELVMAQIRVTDASGTVLSTPRVFAKVGETSSIKIGSDVGATEVRVTSRRDGADVIVDAELTCADGPERLSASAKAQEAAGAEEREWMPVRPDR
jgi:hypothetical protein